MDNKFIDAYCPECAKMFKNKLLFRYAEGTKGTVAAFCKACKKEMKIELGKEPKSR